MGTVICVAVLIFVIGGVIGAIQEQTPTRTPVHRKVKPTRPSVPPYIEWGWRRDGADLCGHYRTKHHAYEGRIENAFSQEPQYYIVRPPKELLSGPNKSCFRRKKKHSYWVHWHSSPVHITEGILAIERAIHHALLDQ